MPVASTEDVPDWVEGKKARQAYMDAFNGCLKKHDGEEKSDDHNCFAIAATAAENAGGGEDNGD